MDITLTPAASGKFISETSPDIKIVPEKCQEIAEKMLDAILDGSIGEIEYKANPLHPKGLSIEEELNWVFLLDTLNFSFWPEHGKHYDVTYMSKKETGYLACCAAFCKAHDKGFPITSAEWMASVDEEELGDILLSDSGHEIPLLRDRVSVLNANGKELQSRFDGEFMNVVRKCGSSAQTLLRLIVSFETFRDMASYNRQKVSFLKRAQILVSDCWGLLKDSEHKELVDFKDLDTITMFADYRVPQALAFLGVLTYSTRLRDELISGRTLSFGDPFEIQLRGCSIHAVELIYKEMTKLREGGYKDQDWSKRRTLYPIDIDVWLWQYRRDHAEAVELFVPHHRTRSIFY